ncbi:MAG: bifunctional DNA primase/polymerase, partial [Alphaproteobacteria bacterium]|nr:bifunctional DNA primase/polymerase [Alphaproteobacteria bacterium]
MRINELCEAALQYAAMGWPVFPCKPRGKRPLTRHGFKDATTDPQTIRDWWQKWPRANVAIATGTDAGFWALDIDVDDKRGRNGNQALRQLEARHGALSKTTQQLTPGGGRHLLFEHPRTKLKNSASKLGPGLDVRGDGGYIIVAPSVHPNGQAYRWAPDGHPKNVAPAPTPEWLRDRIMKLQAPFPAAKCDMSPRHASKYGKAALDRECAAVRAARPGTQSNRLNAAAFSLGQLVGGGTLDREMIELALREATSAWQHDPRKGPWTTEQILQTIRSGLEAGIEQPRTAPAKPNHRRSGYTSSANGSDHPAKELPEIDAADGNLARKSDAAWEALLVSNDPPSLFRYGKQVSRIETDDHRTPIIVPITEDRLRGCLARIISWVKKNKKGEVTPAHPPMPVVKDILAKPNMDLPILYGVVSAPLFAPDGTLQTKPGYHPGSGLFYAPGDDFTIPDVPKVPTEADLKRARGFIVYELLGDFPFTGKAELAHAVAMLLLPFVRPMIAGPTPLHLIEKPSPGTGASLMIDAISIVATGASANVTTEGRDD